ncbi:Uncharacterized protein FWK35_00011066 [Aphis craccivora]|uniref:Uncharacterized protein n=1 Tax=Aphis craccivora TaxID=307492 RepID=A0A6G0XJJ7_APHCR|nr:Uncharacterized protein FWK35_00011066 [Aphis craccivora]
MIRICKNRTWFPNSNWRKRESYSFRFWWKRAYVNQETGFLAETLHARLITLNLNHVANDLMITTNETSHYSRLNNALLDIVVQMGCDHLNRIKDYLIRVETVIVIQTLHCLLPNKHKVVTIEVRETASVLQNSERSDECIDFTMMCVFFIFVSVTTFWSSKSAPILKSGPCF